MPPQAPQTPQAGSNTVTAIDGTPLNPLAVDLAKAIRQTESGGDYNAVGDNGQSHGAYQFNKNNFQVWAKQYGLNPNDFSPVNQDKVAYARIDSLLKEGKSPSEIAAIWNGARVVDGKDVAINPAYVQKVKDNYAKVVGTQPAPTQTDVSAPIGYQPPQPPGQEQAPPTQSDTGYAPPTPPPAPIAVPQTSGQKGGEGILGGISSVLASAEKPFIGLAATPIQAGVAAYNYLTGSHVADPFAGGIKAGLPGVPTQTAVTPLNLEQKAGDIAQVGSYALPGEGLLGAAGMGALQGGGAALSSGGSTADVASQAGAGALVGGALGGLSRLAGYGLQKLGNGLTGAETESALSGLKNAYSQALNLSAGERSFENRTGQDLAQVLMDHQAPLSRNENGTLDASGAISKLEEALQPLNQQASDMLQHPQGVVRDINLTDVLSQVNSRIDSLPITAEDKLAAQAAAKRAIKAEIATHGESVNPATADKIKSGFWNKTFKSKFGTDANVLKKNVHYIIGNTLKTAEEDAIAGTDAEASLKAVNEQRSKLVDALTRLRRIDGVKTVKGGRLGNIAGGLAGTIIGAHSGGLFGGIAGDYLGSKAAEFLNNPETLLAIERMKVGAARRAAGLLPGISKPVGTAASSLGKGLSVGARGAGLLGNLLTRPGQ